MIDEPYRVVIVDHPDAGTKGLALAEESGDILVQFEDTGDDWWYPAHCVRKLYARTG
jgi:hypothetical protein